MADEMKRLTHKDYTAWDLNVMKGIFPHNHNKNWQDLEAKFKRKARRKMKQELKSGDAEMV